MFRSVNYLFRIHNPNRKLTLQATLSTLRKAFVRKMDQGEFMTINFVYSSPMNEQHFFFVRQKSEELKVFCKKIAQRINGDVWTQNQLIQQDVADIGIYINGNKIDGDVLNKSAFQTGAILRIGQAEFEIEVNKPSVLKLILPQSMMAGFHIFPDVEMEFGELQNSEFIWFRSDRQKNLINSVGENGEETVDLSKLKWEQVGEGYSYLSCFDDYGRYLKVRCVPVSNGHRGDPVETISLEMVKKGPGLCPFDKRHAFTKESTKAGRFRIMSYNILAESYAISPFSRNVLYPSCPENVLDIDYRKHLLLKEIHGYNSDIICLQEVDAKLFDSCLNPFLRYFNYKAYFTKRAEGGMAHFYNKNKFSLIGRHDIRFGSALENNSDFKQLLENVSKNEKLKNNLLNRISDAQIAILKCLDVPNRKLCIANAHLFSHPDSRNIRLLQAGILLRHLEQVIAQESRKDPNCSIALVLAGDLNSSPEFGVYELMTKQSIPSDHPDWKCVPTEAIENISLHHSFNLISACGTPPYTNYVEHYNGCLDYIFADKSLLGVEEVVPLPSHEEVTKFPTLPNKTFPSDHLALVCTLKWL